MISCKDTKIQQGPLTIFGDYLATQIVDNNYLEWNHIWSIVRRRVERSLSGITLG